MLRSRLPIVAFVVMAAVSAGCSASGISAHRSGTVQTPLNAAEPTWPATALAGVYPHVGGACRAGSGKPNGVMDVEPGILKASGMPVTPTELAAASNSVVVAKAVDQRAYWTRAGQQDDRVSIPVSLQAAAGGDWANRTVTNLQVLRVLKGPSLGWIQTDQFSTWPNTTLCPGLEARFENWKPMKVGVVYIVFNQQFPIHPGTADRTVFSVPPTATWKTEPWSRFELLGTTVHSEAEEGQAAMPIAPLSLTRFIASLRLS